VRWPALVLAVVFAALGVRSAIHHARRPFGSDDLRDQVLYAVYLTGRVGMWFALAGSFLILAFLGAGEDPTPDPVSGRFDIARASDFTWYLLVFVVLGAMQVLAAWFLGHRGDPSPSSDDDGSTRRP
jgi:hypothetical protein